MKNQSKTCVVCKDKNDLRELMACKMCKLEFHPVSIVVLIQECNFYSDEEIRLHKIELCDFCRTLEAAPDDAKDTLKKKRVCRICTKNDGLLKRWKEKGIYSFPYTWIHPSCMKWFLSIKTAFDNGFSVAVTDKNGELPKETWFAECSLCKKTVKDGRIKCSKKTCANFFHISCLVGANRTNPEYFETMNIEKINHLLYTCDSCRSSSTEISNTKTYGKLINANPDISNKPNILVK